jgi:hypothetical protein
MNLKTLSDELLDENLEVLVLKERALEKEILLYIAEVDLRRLYLKMSYSSLFEYLTKRHGYSNAIAQSRIDLVRLHHEVPTVIEDLEKGDIKISQIGLLKTALRQTAEDITLEQKAEIVESLKNKTMAESQVILAEALNIEIKEKAKVTYLPNAVKLEVSFSLEDWKVMTEMREGLSTTFPIGEWDKVLAYLAKKENEAKNKTPKSQTSYESLKKIVIQRDKCCQYKSKDSSKTCGSKWNLQPDHITPLWAGGEDTLENLRAMCGNHNRQIYREQTNTRRV